MVLTIKGKVHRVCLLIAVHSSTHVKTDSLDPVRVGIRILGRDEALLIGELLDAIVVVVDIPPSAFIVWSAVVWPL